MEVHVDTFIELFDSHIRFPLKGQINKMDSLVCWILLVSVAGHTAGQPGPEVDARRPVPLQSVHQQHTPGLPEEVAVPPAVVDQPPVPCLSLLHHTAVTRTLECAVLAMIVPRAEIITDYSNTFVANLSQSVWTTGTSPFT